MKPIWILIIVITIFLLLLSLLLSTIVKLATNPLFWLVIAIALLVRYH